MADENQGVDIDVTVIVEKDGVIINGNNGVLKSLSSKLGIGKLGYMKLGDK